MLKWHILQILYLLLGSFCQTVENEGNLFVFSLADFSCKSIILTQARTSIVLDWRFLHGCHYFLYMYVCTYPFYFIFFFISCSIPKRRLLGSSVTKLKAWLAKIMITHCALL